MEWERSRAWRKSSGCIVEWCGKRWRARFHRSERRRNAGELRVGPVGIEAGGLTEHAGADDRVHVLSIWRRVHDDDPRYRQIRDLLPGLDHALDYARNRYYSNRLARFLTPDPYQASGGPANPGSWNRYAYVGGDPVNRYDPSGLDDCPPDDPCPAPPPLAPPDPISADPDRVNRRESARSPRGGFGDPFREMCDIAPDERTVGLNLALGVVGGVMVSAEVVLDYHTGQATMVVAAGFGASGAAAQIGASTGFIFGKGDSVPNYASGGNTTVSASVPSGFGISITANSGGLTGNPAAFQPLAATAVSIGYATGLVSLLGGFGAFTQNTLTQVPLGSFISGPAAGLAIPADSLLYLLQTSDKPQKP